MDLRFTVEERRFRSHVRGFIHDHLPRDIHEKMLDHRALTKEDVVLWQRILNRRGWATPSWPKEWGGPGWNVVQR